MPNFNKYQRNRFNQEAIDDTLFNDSFKQRSKIILDAKVIEEPETNDFADTGVFIPPIEEKPLPEEIYNKGLKARGYFIIDL